MQKNKPIKSFRSGVFQISLFVNRKNNRNWLNCVLHKYVRKEQGTSMYPTHIPNVMTILQKMNDYILSEKYKDPKTWDNEPSEKVLFFPPKKRKGATSPE